MGCLWSTLRVIALYCSPSLWCHKMDDVMVHNINSPAAGWLTPSMRRKCCRSSPNIRNHAGGTNNQSATAAACIFKREDKNERGTPVKISVWFFFLPCNTGNPNQNHRFYRLRPNYRYEMCMTLLLVAGVISTPPTPPTHTLSYFNSMSAYLQSG